MSASRVVATAGHVDHGKSTLVRALTGTDPDRFEEEKRRGLTIDIGFAHATLPSGNVVSFVDVPGHVRFLKNMLAGVGAVDHCLFVVAATEGWKPQSEEHLRILELLGVRRGVVALTKADAVDDEWCALARLDVEDRVRGTFLQTAPLVEVDSLSGRGLDALRAALDALLDASPPPLDRERARLWVDRSFAARGAGTVVTGTLTGGSLRVDDTVSVIATAYDGTHTQRRTHTARVRAIQHHGAAVDIVGPGRRVAVNLSGIEHADVGRGDAVVHVGRWHECRRFDASLQVLAALHHDVTRRGAYAAYVGAGEHPVRVRILGPDAIAPGAHGIVRVHLRTALPLLPGDRFVLRDHGRETTVGGGTVLDVAPVRAASRATPDGSLARLVEERAAVPLDLLARLHPDPWEGLVLGASAVDAGHATSLRASLLARIADAAPPGLDLATLGPVERALVERMAAETGGTDRPTDGASAPIGRGDGATDAPSVVLAGGRARIGSGPDLDAHPLLADLRAAGYQPPDPRPEQRRDLRELVRAGLVVERDGVFFAADAVDAAAAAVAALLASRPDGVTVSEVRDAWGSTRKHALPLLAQLDASGVTRRRGDLRVAGPRLPAPTAQPSDGSTGTG